MAKLFLITFFLSCLLGFSLRGDSPGEPLRVIEGKKNFGEYLKESARAYGVPEALAAAMVAQESEAAKSPEHAVRYEPGQLSRGRAAAIKIGLKGSIDFDEQARAFSSSVCPLQVMAYHVAEEGEHWSVLHSPKICAEYGMRIFAKCRERHAKRPPLEREFKALECYNGSSVYSKKVLNRLGERLLAQYLG